MKAHRKLKQTCTTRNTEGGSSCKRKMTLRKNTARKGTNNVEGGKNMDKYKNAQIYSLLTSLKHIACLLHYPRTATVGAAHRFTPVSGQHNVYFTRSHAVSALLTVLPAASVSEVPKMASFGSQGVLLRESWWFLLIRVHFVKNNGNLLTDHPMTPVN